MAPPWAPFVNDLIGAGPAEYVTNPNTARNASVSALISVLGLFIAAVLRLGNPHTLLPLSAVTEPMNRLFPAFLSLRFVAGPAFPSPTIPELEFVGKLLEERHRIGRLFWLQGWSRLFLHLSALFECGLLESPGRARLFLHLSALFERRLLESPDRHLSQNDMLLHIAVGGILKPIPLDTFIPKLV